MLGAVGCQQDSNKINRYRGFDGLRGLSILFVVIGHLGFWSQLPAVGMARKNPVLSNNEDVTLFHIFDKFLITNEYAQSAHSTANPIYWLVQ